MTRKSLQHPSGSLLASIAIHLLLVVALAQVFTHPYRIRPMADPVEGEIVVERIGFLALPTTGAEPRPGRSGGDGRPETPERPARPVPRLVAPREVPSGLPALPEAQPEAAAGGSGEVIGAGGPLRGMRPSFSDPRVWTVPGPFVTAPRTPSQRLDSLLASRLGARQDSIDALGTPREPGDWTFERDGRTWGVDRDYIRLGDVSIPTAVLALLPLNVQANPIAMDNAKRLNAMHADIAEHAQRAVNEAEFRDAVKRLRERKDRERAAARAKLAGTDGEEEKIVRRAGSSGRVP
ncbi:MAG: hypothetical protein ACRENI_01930 [Gemmatimonadaceae bacterium]